MTLASNSSVALCGVEECAGKESESGNKGEEDEEEDQVGADGADEVDEAKYAHAEHEVCCNDHQRAYHRPVSLESGKTYQFQH